MSLKDVISAIDAEIDRIEQARALLTGTVASKRGRQAATKSVKAKRAMSAEARQRIADAQRKRWAAQKRAAKP